MALAAFAGALGTWLVIVGLLGLGRRHLDRPSAALSYLARASYPAYIIHQTVIVIAAYFIVKLPISEPIQWLVLLWAGVAATYGTYEVVRRIPFVRAGFGIRGRAAGARG